MLLHWGYLFGFVSALKLFQSAQAHSSCQEHDSSHLSSRDFHKQRLSLGNVLAFTTSVPQRVDIASFIHKLEHSNYGDKPLIKKVLSLIVNNAKSPHFKDQWEAVLRTGWITGGLLGEVNTEKMCVIADMINTGVEAENSLCDNDQWSCSFDEFQYSLMDAIYSTARGVLSEQGCPTAGVPKMSLPECFKFDKCLNEGRTYQIDEYWEEYDGSLAEIEKSGIDVNDCPTLRTIAKEFYESDDLRENYLGGILTATAMGADWLWKADKMQSDTLSDAVKSLGLFQEAITSLKKCPCDQLEDSLVKKAKQYGVTVAAIFDMFKKNLAKMETGHVSKWKNHGHSHPKKINMK